MESKVAHQVEDAQILEAISNPVRKEQGFRWLLQKYQERLYWHIRRMVVDHEDAHDVVQNTLIKVYRSIDRFKGDSKLYTWLYRIATNESITFINKRKKRQAISIDESEIPIINTLQADPFFNGDEALIKLKAAVMSLPEKQQLVFNMRYYDELSYQDISDVLGTSVGGLKASFHHAVKKIEAYIKG